MKRAIAENLARSLAQGLVSMYEGYQAEKDFSDWQSRYTQPRENPYQIPQSGVQSGMQSGTRGTAGRGGTGRGGTGRGGTGRAAGGPMFGDIGAQPPAPRVDEAGLAALVAKLGNNPMAGKYLQSGELMFKASEREAQAQAQAVAQAREEAERERAQQVAVNQAMMSLLGQQGQRPALANIPRVAGTMTGGQALDPSMFEAAPKPREKVDVGAAIIDLGGGQLGQIGYDDYGNQTVIPLPQGAKPYKAPSAGGGGDPALTWAMNQALSSIHAERQSSGTAAKDLHREYQEIQKLPSSREINQALASVRKTGDDTVANRLNAKYGDVIAPDEKGVWRLMPEVRTREGAMADWKARKRANEERYNLATEKLKGAASSGRKDPAGRTSMSY
jgi:hypothetical protein